MKAENDAPNCPYLCSTSPSLFLSSMYPIQCWNFKQSMCARNRVGIGLLYLPAGLHRLEELIPWNRFLGSLKLKKFRLRLARGEGSRAWPGNGYWITGRHVWAPSCVTYHALDLILYNINQFLPHLPLLACTVLTVGLSSICHLLSLAMEENILTHPSHTVYPFPPIIFSWLINYFLAYFPSQLSVSPFPLLYSIMVLCKSTMWPLFVLPFIFLFCF